MPTPNTHKSRPGATTQRVSVAQLGELHLPAVKVAPVLGTNGQPLDLNRTDTPAERLKRIPITRRLYKGNATQYHDHTAGELTWASTRHLNNAVKFGTLLRLGPSRPHIENLPRPYNPTLILLCLTMGGRDAKYNDYHYVVDHAGQFATPVPLDRIASPSCLRPVEELPVVTRPYFRRYENGSYLHPATQSVSIGVIGYRIETVTQEQLATVITIVSVLGKHYGITFDAGFNVIEPNLWIRKDSNGNQLPPVTSWGQMRKAQPLVSMFADQQQSLRGN